MTTTAQTFRELSETAPHVGRLIDELGLRAWSTFDVTGGPWHVFVADADGGEHHLRNPQEVDAFIAAHIAAAD